MNDLGAILQRIGGRRAVSPGAWLVLSPIAILGVYFSFGAAAFGPDHRFLIVTSLLSYLVGGPIFLIAWLTYLSPITGRKARPVLALITFTVAGLASGSVLSLLLFYSRIDADLDLIDRTLSRAWLGVFWSIVVTLVLDASDRYRETASKLNDEAANLRVLLKTRGDYVFSVRKQMVDTVTKTISQALATSGPKELNKVADQVIAPLTRFLEAKGRRPYELPLRNLEKVKIGPVVSRALSSPENIVLIATLGAIYPALVLVGRFGVLGALSTLMIWIVAFSFLHLARIFSDGKGYVGFLILLIGAITTLLAAIALELVFTGNVTSLGNLSLGSWIIIPFFLVGMEFERAGQEALDMMREKNAQARWVQQRLQQEIWVESRKLARVVHGTVQGKIRAAAISKAKLAAADLEALRAECIHLVEVGPEPQTLHQFIDQSRRLWRGILDIELSAPVNVVNVVESDPIALTSLLEVLREAFTNAVRHGSATKASVQLQISSKLQRNQLIVRVKNNGSPLARRRSSGFGSSVFDEVTSEWTIRQTNSQVELLAYLLLDVRD